MIEFIISYFSYSNHNKFLSMFAYVMGAMPFSVFLKFN